MESYAIARDDAYGKLPQPSAPNTYGLTDDYIVMATQDAAMQLSKAGVRLAYVLNTALNPPR